MLIAKIEVTSLTFPHVIFNLKCLVIMPRLILEISISLQLNSLVNNKFIMSSHFQRYLTQWRLESFTLRGNFTLRLFSYLLPAVDRLFIITFVIFNSSLSIHFINILCNYFPLHRILKINPLIAGAETQKRKRFREFLHEFI